MTQTLYLIISASTLVYLAKFDHYGLYIAIALFWVISAFYKPLTSIAIWSIVVFMAGFALMRLINITSSGVPSSYYLIILLGEILIMLIGIILIKSN